MPYTKLPESEGYVLCYKAEGDITAEDYTERLIPALEKAFQYSSSGKARLLVDLRGIDLTNFNFAALWEDTKFGISKAGKFERLAVIGDKKWEELFVGLAKPLYPGCDIEFFKEEIDEEEKSYSLPLAPVQWIFAGTSLQPRGIIHISANENISNDGDIEISNNGNPFISHVNYAVCLDESEEAQIALREALTFIKNPKIDLLHLIAIHGKHGEEKTKEIMEHAIQTAKEEFSISHSDDEQLEIKTHIRKLNSASYPGAAIIDIAKKIPANYIFVGNRGKGTLRKFFLGSVSNYVVEHASCPVILCKKH